MTIVRLEVEDPFECPVCHDDNPLVAIWDDLIGEQFMHACICSRCGAEWATPMPYPPLAPDDRPDLGVVRHTPYHE